MHLPAKLKLIILEAGTQRAPFNIYGMFPFSFHKEIGLFLLKAFSHLGGKMQQITAGEADSFHQARVHYLFLMNLQAEFSRLASCQPFQHPALQIHPKPPKIILVIKQIPNISTILHKAIS